MLNEILQSEFDTDVEMFELLYIIYFHINNKYFNYWKHSVFFLAKLAIPNQKHLKISTKYPEYEIYLISKKI